MAKPEDKEETTSEPGLDIDHLSKRASELAMNHGRPADAVTEADLAWAERELKPMELSSPSVLDKSTR